MNIVSQYIELNTHLPSKFQNSTHFMIFTRTVGRHTCIFLAKQAVELAYPAFFVFTFPQPILDVG